MKENFEFKEGDSMRIFLIYPTTCEVLVREGVVTCKEKMKSDGGIKRKALELNVLKRGCIERSSNPKVQVQNFYGWWVRGKLRLRRVNYKRSYFYDCIRKRERI